MGKGTGMGRLIGPFHHQLQIGQQLSAVCTAQARGDLRLPAHRWQWGSASSIRQPVAQQIAGLMQKILELSIERLRRGERIQPVRHGQQR